MANKTIVQECPECGGTGLYSGFCEGPGCAVVCLGCSGQGWSELTYREYTGRRKMKRGIKKVQASAGRFIVTGVGGFGKDMTYEEFLVNYPEKKSKYV